MLRYVEQASSDTGDEVVGEMVGAFVGIHDGDAVGRRLNVGILVVGDIVGLFEEAMVGTRVGAIVETTVDGATVGD